MQTNPTLRRTLIPLVCVVATGWLALIHAQVPSLISYQGRLVVGGTNYDASAEFKFAFVDGPGTNTFWSNDGTSSEGSEPLAAVTLPVTKGLYSVLLGDTSRSNMAPIPSSVFTQSDVRLRVWYRAGFSGFDRLLPDQRLAAVAYALMAADVADGSIGEAKLAAGAVTVTKLADLSVTTSKLAIGAVGTAQLAAGAVDNTKLLNNGLTVTPGTGLVGGGPVSLGGSTTLGLADEGVTSTKLAVDSGSLAKVSGGLVSAGLTNLQVNGQVSASLFSGVLQVPGNARSDPSAAVGGGENNWAGGPGATIPGGIFNQALGATAFAAGYRAKANDSGTFVWADGTEADFVSSSPNQFLIRASGGVGIGTETPAALLHIRGSAALRDGLRIDLDQAGPSGLESTAIRIINRSAPSPFGEAVLFEGNDGFFYAGNMGNEQNQGYARLDSTGTWTVVSDAQQKLEVAPLEGLLDKTMRLRPVSFFFTWQDRHHFPDKRIGLIAQEVEPLFPSLVVTGDGKSLDYASLSVVAIGALQEFKQRHDQELADREARHQAELTALRARLDAVSDRLDRTIAGQTPSSAARTGAEGGHGVDSAEIGGLRAANGMLEARLTLLEARLQAVTEQLAAGESPGTGILQAHTAPNR